MGIADLVRKISNKRKEKSEKFKQMEEDYRLQKMLEERQKSSNERELERIIEKKRQEQISNTLKEIRKQETSEMWKGNMFAGKCTILDQDKNILTDNKKMGIGKGNMLVDKKNKVPLQNKRKGMFFRW